MNKSLILWGSNFYKEWVAQALRFLPSRQIMWLLEEVTERPWPPVDPWAWPGQLEAPHPPPQSLECTFCPPFPQWEPFLRTQAWESNALLRTPGWCKWLKASMQSSKLLAGGCRDLLVLLPKTSLICKLPGLSTLPPTNLEWPASFFGLALPFLYGGQFANQEICGEMFKPV